MDLKEISAGELDVHHDMPEMDTITLCIKRGKNGYGFSVTGANPARIGRVSQDSVSYQAGLRQGDCVVRINGQNVSRSIADSIAKIVRQSERQIILDIERDGQGEGYPNKHGHKSSTRAPLATISELPNDSNKITCKADIEPLPRVPSNDSLNSYQSHSSGSAPEHLIDIGDWESPKSGSFPQIKVSFQELSESEQDRQAAVQQMVSSEEEFVAQMHYGIQRYSRPLRNRLISPSEHVTLFQNVEKLAAISEFHVYKLKEESIGYSDVKKATEKFIDGVGAVYLPKVNLMTELYEEYCNGIKNAFRLLAELRDFEEFESFLTETPVEAGQPSISGFIKRPLQHIKDIVLNLQKILALTTLDHQDSDNLTQVVETLRNTCNTINENNARRCKSMTSLSSRSSSRSSRSKSSGDSTAVSVLSDSSGSSIESSVDCAVMEVQRRLVFCEHVQAFHLATATRHMIYAGELMHMDGLLCTKLHVVLMSDLLLLTREEQNGRLMVIDFPILLHDIIQTDFRTQETMDFDIRVESSIDTEWVEARQITLRAPSLEQKYTWKNILLQHMETCKLQQQFFCLDNIV